MVKQTLQVDQRVYMPFANEISEGIVVAKHTKGVYVVRFDKGIGAGNEGPVHIDYLFTDIVSATIESATLRGERLAWSEIQDLMGKK